MVESLGQGRRAVVVGAGVSGLSVALRLLESGFSVEILARDAPLDTTSRVAGAFWYPYHAEPAERVVPWARRGLAVLSELAGVPGSGVHRRTSIVVDADPADPLWSGGAGLDAREARPDELPKGAARGVAYRAPAVDMPRYLAFLLERIDGLGGSVRIGELRSLDEAAEGGAEVVFDCAGLGARELARDSDLHPIRGQVLHVARRGQERCLVDFVGGGDPSYVVPREEVCVLGGTSEDGDGSLEPREESTRAILARCAALEPSLADAEVLAVEVGLRPGRSEVRLELDRLGDGTPLVHDYGHGGAGVTLSWGCAEEAVELALRALDRARQDA